MARDDPQFSLRLPQDLKNRIDAAASANKRSLNAELVARLEESFDGVKGSTEGVAIAEDSVRQIADKVVHALEERDRRRKTR
jgi:hypothetical protein